MQALYQWLAAGLLVAAVAVQCEAKPPHILFFMADDVGWHNVGWHNPDMKTPNADRLVQEGIELDRHYAFVFCSPSRSSLMTGRLPFHVQQENFQNCDLAQGAARNFTFISAKLKSAGYATHHIGKWHLGQSSLGHIPAGRGFDTSLVYFEGAEDHWNQLSCVDGECIRPVYSNDSYPLLNMTTPPFDFWMNDGPAKEQAGSRYSGYQYNDFGVDAINAHDPSTPFFMYFAAANSHTPLEAPQAYLDLYPEDWYLDRRQYAAMCSFWDDLLGNLTGALKAKGMYDDTLIVFSSDNGGPAYWSTDPAFQHGAGANNWPLKGSKVSAWEGGIRVAAFVSGGIVPSAMRGKKIEEHIHMADWYATFCGLAGVDPTDTEAAKAGLPSIDSLDMWPLLSGQTQSSPRVEVPVVINFKLLGNISVLIQGDYKLIEGEIPLTYYQGPDFPNATSAPYGQFSNKALWHLCLPCLYNIKTDPTEQNDIFAENRELGLKMAERIRTLKESTFQRPSAKELDACGAQVRKNGGFYGPWLP